MSCKPIAMCLYFPFSPLSIASPTSPGNRMVLPIFSQKHIKFPKQFFLWSLNSIVPSFFLHVVKAIPSYVLLRLIQPAAHRHGWRRERHLNRSLCSTLSTITINPNCRSCSASRAEGVRNSWRAFFIRHTMLTWHLPSNQLLKLQARKGTYYHPSLIETTDPLISAPLIHFGFISHQGISTRGVIYLHCLKFSSQAAVLGNSLLCFKL